MKRGIRKTFTACVMALAATAALTGPATAAEDPEVALAPDADAQTVAIAESSPQAVATGSNVCGTGYELSRATPLPKGIDPDMRHATLYSYTKGGNDYGCSILDNNLLGAKRMRVSVCDSQFLYCDVDDGKYTYYAGPVYTGYPVCAVVYARQWFDDGTQNFDYRSQYEYLCN